MLFILKVFGHFNDFHVVCHHLSFHFIFYQEREKLQGKSKQRSRDLIVKVRKGFHIRSIWPSTPFVRIISRKRTLCYFPSVIRNVYHKRSFIINMRTCHLKTVYMYLLSFSNSYNNGFHCSSENINHNISTATDCKLP